MIKGSACLLILTSLLMACSGSIYRQRPVTGSDPVAITVDARQRVLLSQPDEDRNRAATDPQFRRFCAEPSPDVFTVLGVSGSGGGSLGLGADQSVNAALQAAFSSSETGATIARTQTLNMLREMMFRTCERYLSGAISSAEFAVVAARDQRTMISILAIEQLTGSITPRALSITSGGNAVTGMNPTDLVRALGTAREAVTAADEDVAAKAKKQAEADVPAGNCAALRLKKAAGTPALTADESNKLKACDDADAAYAAAKSKRDAAQAHYDALIAASKGGVGTSSASTSGTVQFASDTERSAAVSSVANAVRSIVDHTFDQDETQLFCIRTLFGNRPVAREDPLYERCMSYLLVRVEADRDDLARRYGVSPAQYRTAVDQGRQWRLARENLAACVIDPGNADAIKRVLAATPALASHSEPLLAAAKESGTALSDYLVDIGSAAVDQLALALMPTCSPGG